MKLNQILSTKVSSDWLAQLTERCELEGLTQSEALRKAVGQYLGIEAIEEDTPVGLLRFQIESLQNRVAVLEARDRGTGHAMNIVQLHELLVERGYDAHQQKLRRALAEAQKIEQLPQELIDLGVKADWEAGKVPGYKRWLYLDSSEVTP